MENRECQFGGQVLKEERLLERGQFILDRLGLKLEDLKGKVVIDLGAGECAVGRLAEVSGIDSVVSLDKNKDILLASEVKDKVQGEAQILPLKDRSVDLFISNGAPPGVNKKEQLALSVLDEIERVLKDTGEARIALASLRFIDDRVMREYLIKKVSNNKALAEIFTHDEKDKMADIDLRLLGDKISKVLDKKDREIIKLLGIAESAVYLKNKGYNVESRMAFPFNQNNDRDAGSDYFWILKKREIKK